MCHAFNKRRFVFYELISPNSYANPPFLSKSKGCWEWLSTTCCGLLAFSLLVSLAIWLSPPEELRMRHPLSHSLHYYQPKVFKQVPGMLQTFFTFPIRTLIQAPNQKASCHHWSVVLQILQWETCEKPWMFDQNCTLLMKSSISQLEVANAPSSPQVPSS